MIKSLTTEFKARVVLEILREEKSLSQIAAEYDVHPNQLGKWKKASINGLPEVLADGRRKDSEKEKLRLQVEVLYTQLGETTAQLNWLKKNLESTLHRDDRISLVDFNDMKMSIVKQAEMLSLNRSGLYYEPAPPSEKEVALKHAIDRIYTEDPFFGSRKISAILIREGYETCRTTIQRIMHLLVEIILLYINRILLNCIITMRITQITTIVSIQC
jgi:putative transposase